MTERQDASNNPEIARVIREMTATVGSCLLCGAPTRAAAAFIPGDLDPGDFGVAPEGKQRTYFYRACDRCARDPKTPELAEEIIRRDLRGEGGA